MRDALAVTAEDADLRRRARSWLLVGLLTVGAVAVLAGTIWLGGDDGLDNVPASVDTGDGDDTEEPAEPEADEDLEAEVEDLPTVTYEVYLARDPFEPVRTPPTEGDGDGDGDGDTIVIGDGDDDPSDPADPSDPTDPSDPSDPGDPDDPSTPSPGAECEGNEDEAVCDGHVLSLLEITTQNGEQIAVIQVDTTVYEVREGETFAGSFHLLQIDPDRQRVEGLFGDADFRLRVGERTLK